MYTYFERRQALIALRWAVAVVTMSLMGCGGGGPNFPKVHEIRGTVLGQILARTQLRPPKHRILRPVPR